MLFHPSYLCDIPTLTTQSYKLYSISFSTLYHPTEQQYLSFRFQRSYWFPEHDEATQRGWSCNQNSSLIPEIPGPYNSWQSLGNLFLDFLERRRPPHIEIILLCYRIIFASTSPTHISFSTTRDDALTYPLNISKISLTSTLFFQRFLPLHVITQNNHRFSQELKNEPTYSIPSFPVIFISPSPHPHFKLF